MKAIKLASVFAVSAVAAAVSTTTFAADAVFSGYAGIAYYSGDGAEANYDYTGYGSVGELNIVVDTGSFYLRMDMNNVSSTDDSTFVLDEAYYTAGAVSFGDFDGSLSDSAVMYGGVKEGNDYSTDFDNTLGVRYAVNDDLTVAVEAEEGANDAYLTAAYSHDFGALALTVSGGYADTDADNATAAVGVSVPMGMATLQAYYQAGSVDDADVSSYGAGVDLALTDALTVSVAYYASGEDVTSDGVTTESGDTGITEGTVYYTVGDITYYATYLDYKAADSDYSILGVKASF